MVPRNLTNVLLIVTAMLLGLVAFRVTIVPDAPAGTSKDWQTYLPVFGDRREAVFYD
jgi:hypothetical protein